MDMIHERHKETKSSKNQHMLPPKTNQGRNINNNNKRASTFSMNSPTDVNSRILNEFRSKY